jgi:hypothetical protein
MPSRSVPSGNVTMRRTTAPANTRSSTSSRVKGPSSTYSPARILPEARLSQTSRSNTAGWRTRPRAWSERPTSAADAPGSTSRVRGGSSPERKGIRVSWYQTA